jgi:hypothetical protein
MRASRSPAIVRPHQLIMPEAPKKSRKKRSQTPRGSFARMHAHYRDDIEQMMSEQPLTLFDFSDDPDKDAEKGADKDAESSSSSSSSSSDYNIDVASIWARIEESERRFRGEGGSLASARHREIAQQGICCCINCFKKRE